MLVDAGAEFSELRRAPSGAVDTAVAARPLREGARVRRPRWMRRYRAALVVLDILIASAAAAVMIALRPGLSATSASYVAQSLALPVLWMSFLAVANAHSPTHLGNGS